MIDGFLSSAEEYNLQTQLRLLYKQPCGSQGKISGMELPRSSGFAMTLRLSGISDPISRQTYPARPRRHPQTEQDKSLLSPW